MFSKFGIAVISLVMFSLSLSLALKAESTGDAAKGKEKFDAFCVACHGAGGKGDGPAAAALDPKPRDLSDAAIMSTVTDEHLTKVIKEGGAAVGKSVMMPAWGGSLSDEDVTNIITYIRKDLCKCEYKH